MLNDYEKVKETIINAFSEVPYPGDDAVTFIGVEDPEMIEGIDLLRGKHWHEVTSATIEECHSCFLFLPAKALHFYLPAFMIEYLTWEADRESEQLLVAILTRPYHHLEELLGGPEMLTGLKKSRRGPRPRTSLEGKVKQGSLLTKEQAEAIGLYLLYVARKSESFADDVEDATDFWDKTAKKLSPATQPD